MASLGGTPDSFSPSAEGLHFNPMDMEEFRRQAHKIIDFIVDYYHSAETRPVLPSVSPGYLRELLPAIAPDQPVPFDAVLREISSAILPGITHWISPSFFAYFPLSFSPAALLADLISSALACNPFDWLASPAATELENVAVDWLAQILHLPPCFRFDASDVGGGVIQANSGEAVVCTLVAARDSTVKRLGFDNAAMLTVYGSDQTHCSFFKACRIVGFSPENIRAIETHRDSAFSLSPVSLRRAMDADVANGLVPAYVCATVGTTSSTAVDPIGPIADVAARHGAWVHVDAAYAGNACICPEFVEHIAGLERVDSVIVNLHKGLLTGPSFSCLWVKDRTRLAQSLGTNPEYLKNHATQTGSVVSYKDWQVGLSRRFRSLSLYMVIRSYGAANLRSHVRSHVRLAAKFEGMVRSDPRFEVVVPRLFALVCFRLRPEGVEDSEVDALNRRLLAAVNEDGQAYMSHTVLGGLYVIRFAVGATLTEERHVVAAWRRLRDKADELLK